jgi:hypothetical protein
MGRVESVGRTVALNQWGDPPAFARRAGGDRAPW